MVHGSQSHRSSPLAAQVRRRKLHRQLLPPCGQPQVGAVPAQPEGCRAILQLFLQLGQRQRLVLGQPGQRSRLPPEQRRIDLPAAGIHHRDDRPLKAKKPVGDGLRGGDPDAGGPVGERQSLYGGYADAQPRKGARPPAHRIIVHLLRGYPGVLQQALCHRQQRHAVGLRYIQELLPQQLPVPVQRRRSRSRGAFQRKQQHSLSPFLAGPAGNIRAASAAAAAPGRNSRCGRAAGVPAQPEPTAKGRRNRRRRFARRPRPRGGAAVTAARRQGAHRR